jgi:hypothetical protein
MLWFRIDASKELSRTTTAEPAVAVVTSTVGDV